MTLQRTDDQDDDIEFRPQFALPGEVNRVPRNRENNSQGWWDPADVAESDVLMDCRVRSQTRFAYIVALASRRSRLLPSTRHPAVPKLRGKGR